MRNRLMELQLEIERVLVIKLTIIFRKENIALNYFTKKHLK